MQSKIVNISIHIIINYFPNVSKYMKTIEEMKGILITENPNYFSYCLLLLKDSRIALCSSAKIVKIIDPSNEFNCDITIDLKSDYIMSVCQIDNGHIITATLDCDIYILSITKFTFDIILVIPMAHLFNINKIVALGDNKFASCSRDMSIKIWSQTSKEPITVIKDVGVYISSLLFLEDKNLLIAGTGKGIRKYNANTYRFINKVSKIICTCQNCLNRFDENRLIITGYTNIIHIVNIEKCVIENLTEFFGISFTFTFIKLNEEIFLCGCEKGKFLIYNINTKEYILNKSSHYKDITCLLHLGKNLFISSSRENFVKIWKYN